MELVHSANEMISTLNPSEKKKLDDAVIRSSSEHQPIRIETPELEESPERPEEGRSDGKGEACAKAEAAEIGGVGASNGTRDGEKESKVLLHGFQGSDVPEEFKDNSVVFIVHPHRVEDLSIPILWKIIAKVSVLRSEGFDSIGGVLPDLSYRQFCLLYSRMLQILGQEGSSASGSACSQGDNSRNSKLSGRCSTQGTGLPKFLEGAEEGSSAPVGGDAATSEVEEPPTRDSPEKSRAAGPFVSLTDSSYQSFGLSCSGFDNSCPVCMERPPGVVLGCLHEFCEECLTNWSARSDTCPLCRAKDIDVEEAWTLTSTPSSKELVVYLLKAIEEIAGC